MNAPALYRSKIRGIDTQHRGDLGIACKKTWWVPEELDEEGK
jgi:hypothetical protein